MAYTLQGRKSGTVRFIPLQNGVVEKESESYSSAVTSNPIENGADLNDHVNNQSGELEISGTIIGGDFAINALKRMRDLRDIITYTGITRMTNLVFTSLKFSRSYKNRDGASFSATFKQVQISSSEYVPSDSVLSMISQDAGRNYNQQLSKTSNAGLIMIAQQSVSSASAARYEAIYSSPNTSAPLTRLTGSYDGLTTRRA